MYSSFSVFAEAVFFLVCVLKENSYKTGHIHEQITVQYYKMY